MRDTWNAATRGTGNAAPLLGAGIAAIEEAPKVARSLRESGIGIDSATQAAESTAKVAARGAGAGIGTKLGAGAGMALGAPLAPFTFGASVPVGGLLGGLAGGYIGDRLANAGVDAAISAGRSAVGVAPKLTQASETLRTPPTVTSGPPLTDAQKQMAITDTARARQEAGMPPANRFQASALAYKPEQPSTVNFQKGNSFSVVPAGSHVSQYGFVSADPLTPEQQAGVDARIKAQGGGQDEYGNYLTPQAMAYRQERLRGGGAQQPTATEPVIFGDGGGYGILSKEFQAKSELEAALKKQPGESRTDYNARLDFLASTRGQDLGERSSLRTDGTQRRGQDMTQSTTLRGQDMDLQGRLLPKQMEMQYAAQQRGLRAEAFKQAGGDYSRMADLLASQGLDPGDALKAASDRQTYGTKAEEQARGMFKGLFDTPTDKDRTDLEASAYARLMEMSGGKFNQLPKEQQDLLRTSAIAEVRELGQANQKRGGGFWEAVGIDNPPPEFSNLPSASERKNATLRQADFLEWANPFKEIDKGDWVETLQDGRQYRTGPLSESRIDERLQQGAQRK